MSEAATQNQAADRRFLGAVPGRWLWLALTVLLFALLIALAVWFWWFRKPLTIERIIPAQQAELAPDVKARAGALEKQIAEIEKAIAEAKADNQTQLCPPGQKLKQGANALPAAPLAPISADPVKHLSISELSDKLEGATVLVLAENSVATGFFIAPDLLVTNRHAVESSKNGKVFIASRSLGRVRPGEVVRTSAAGNVGAADFALVRMTDGSAPAVLSLSGQNGKLTSVVAAGYPGLTLQNDTGFRRLIAGDAQASPDLNLTQGVVQSLQTSPQGVPVIVHTASILQGNSGGPLVDTCGRVLGINTFITVDAGQSGRVSYAQTASAISDFLAQSGGRLPLDNRVCPAS